MTESVSVTKQDINVTAVQNVNTITVSTVGFQGPKGKDGLDGAPGAPGIPGVANPAYYSFTFEQQSNANVWTINHNLGYKPSVDIIDYGGNNIEADISHIDSASLTVTLNPAASGYAYLS